MDPTLLAAWGLPGLFLAALLAGSVAPLPSEAVLVALLGSGLDPALAVSVATCGNLLGAATLYLLGGMLSARLGDGWASARGRRIAQRFAGDPQRLERTAARLRRFGAPLLLLSWLPVVGDALVLAAGMVGVRPLPFALCTAAGKAARYGAVASGAVALLGAAR